MSLKIDGVKFVRNAKIRSYLHSYSAILSCGSILDAPPCLASTKKFYEDPHVPTWIVEPNYLSF